MNKIIDFNNRKKWTKEEQEKFEKEFNESYHGEDYTNNCSDEDTELDKEV